jgi:hypothetical protein
MVDEKPNAFVPIQSHIVGITLEDALNIPRDRYRSLIWFLDDIMRDRKKYRTKADLVLAIANRNDLTTVERTYLGYMLFQRMTIMRYGVIGELAVSRV